MTWVVCAPSVGDANPALLASRWVAERTLDASGGQTVALLGAMATRAALAATAGAGHDGMAFFGHGKDDHLVGADGGALLDRSNAALLAGRWVHAFACRAGIGLGAVAVRQGVACCAAYTTRLILEWDPTDIPAAYVDAFIRLVTSTTLLLAGGERDPRRLRSAAAVIADQIIVRLDAEAPGDRVSMYIQITAEQLVDRLVVFLR